jgi:hypothetical protein
MCRTAHSTSLRFCWWDVSDGFQQAAVVKPIDPFECFPLDSCHGFPWTKPVDDVGFVEAVYRFGQALPDRRLQSNLPRGHYRKRHRRCQQRVQSLPRPIARYSEWRDIARRGPKNRWTQSQ